MLEKAEQMVKGLFSGDGIEEALLTDKGVRMIIDRIPEEFIAMLAELEYSELAINAVAVFISKMTPEQHKEKAKDILRTAVASLDERVDDYREEHAIEAPKGKKKKTDTATIESVSSATSTGPTNAEIVTEHRQAIMHPRFKSKKAARLDALNKVYERPSVKTDTRYFGADKSEYRAKVDAVLAGMSEDAIFALLDDTPQNRKIFINNAVGELKVARTAMKIATGINQGAKDICSGLGLTNAKHAIDGQITVHRAQMAKDNAGWRKWLKF